MNKVKIKKVLLGIGAISILLGGTIVFSETGSEKDPLVSLSYLEKTIDNLKKDIDKKLSNVGNNEENNISNGLEVVEVPVGQSIIGENGTEIILRGGKGKIIAGELGGLSDVTDGRDLKMDDLVPANHLLIVPRNDGRGVYAITDAIFLVRGEYKIK